MSNLTVANEIRRQLGHRCLYMLGAQNFVGSDNSLSFHIRGCRKINGIRIILEPDDTYKVTFSFCRNFDRRVVSSHSDVYAEDLHGLIERQTGLRTSLFGRVVEQRML